MGNKTFCAFFMYVFLYIHAHYITRMVIPFYFKAIFIDFVANKIATQLHFV